MRLEWQELDSWAVLGRAQVDLRGAVVERAAEVAAVVPVEALRMKVAAVVRGSEVQAVIPDPGNSLVEHRVLLVCHPRSVVLC